MAALRDEPAFRFFVVSATEWKNGGPRLAVASFADSALESPVHDADSFVFRNPGVNEVEQNVASRSRIEPALRVYEVNGEILLQELCVVQNIHTVASEAGDVVCDDHVKL